MRSLEQKLWEHGKPSKVRLLSWICGVSFDLLACVHEACLPSVANYGCKAWGLQIMAIRQICLHNKLRTAKVN